MKKDKNHNSKLETVEKKEVFTAPDGYFDQLQNNVFDKIENQESKKVSKSGKQIFFNPFWMSVAAAIVVLIVAFFSLKDSINKTEVGSYYAIINKVSSDEIVAYLEQSDLTINELEEALRSEDLDNLNSIKTDTFKNYSDDELDDLYEYYSL